MESLKVVEDSHNIENASDSLFYCATKMVGFLSHLVK